MTTEVSSTSQHDGIRRLIQLAADRNRGDSYAGRRQETRFRYPLELEACLDPSDTSATMVAKLHDICGAGIAIWIRPEIDVGTVIYIREFGAESPGEWLRANVSRVGRGIFGALTAATFDTPLPADEAFLPNDESFEEGCEIESDSEEEECSRHGFWSWLGLGD